MVQKDYLVGKGIIATARAVSRGRLKALAILPDFPAGAPPAAGGL